MSSVAEVLRSDRVVEDDSTHGVDTVCDPGGGQNVTCPQFDPSGVDSMPLAGDFAALTDSAGAGASNVVGYADVRNAGKAAAGEIRLYARNASGAPVSEAWLRGNGSVVITNFDGAGLPLGRIEMAANGDVNINGVVISASGEVTAPAAITADGEITAMAASPATSIGLSTHQHGSGVGPTSSPLPGT